VAGRTVTGSTGSNFTLANRPLLVAAFFTSSLPLFQSLSPPLLLLPHNVRVPTTHPLYLHLLYTHVVIQLPDLCVKSVSIGSLNSKLELDVREDSTCLTTSWGTCAELHIFITLPHKY
jgi:hypothetical protein